MEEMITKLKQLGVIDWAVNIIGAILIFFIGRWVARLVRRIVEGIMTKSKQEETLVRFVGNLTYIAGLAFVIIAALEQLGVKTASFVVVIGAAGLAIGLALQGSLANFAAGVLLIIFHPFKVGDYIEAAGVEGVVADIEIFTTTLLTLDNKTIVIPNAKVSNENLVNFTAEKKRRVDLVVGVSYDADIDRAREVIAETLAANDKILADPPVQIAVSELADSSVNFVVRPWANTTDYWDVYFSVTEAVKKNLDAAGIGIPYPQRDVHVYKHE